MTHNFPRHIRIAQLIKEEISNLIISQRLKDPRIGFITITKVKISKDLKNCKVFVSIYENEEKKRKTLEGLSHAEGFIKQHIAKNLRLKYIPSIQFEQDLSIEYSDHISRIIESLDIPK
jgi:ribosome-binding factor A